MIGRYKEKKKIDLILNARKSQFIAVTGRRRVGKTFLIDTLLKNQYCFSLTGIQNGNTLSQIINFSVKLSEYSGNTLQNTPKDWQAAILQLKTYLKTLDKTRKQVIFIDELPWVHTPKSGFIQLLAHLWNDYLSKESHFILVICGSATSWITKNIINDKGGLHNRVTEVLHLSPFTLAETKEFITSKGLRLSNQDITKIYMALGGIPFYLDNLRKGESFSAAIERMCFSPTGLLKNEYNNLYLALFNHADIHLDIVEALAGHPNGMLHADILKKIGMHATGSYQRAIKELVLSDFVMETRPFGKKKRGAYYRLIDEYSVFYHRFIKPNKKYTQGMWQQLAASQAYKIWAGYAFESLCHKHIDQIKKALGIGAVYTEISGLQVAGTPEQEGVQIDLLIDRKDDSINLCEIKFHAGPYTINKARYLELINKKQRFVEFTRTKKQVFLTLISNHGVVSNEYSTELVEAEVVLEELMVT